MIGYSWQWVSLGFQYFSICFAAETRLDGRYSFSLTTFDPNGKLNQVERACRASTIWGTPVVATFCSPDDDDNHSSVIFLAPQILPNNLYEDDGTARFVKISNNIMVAHSGISADARIAIAAGQQLAIEHEYTFDEEIPIQIFLESMALLFQEYTMKAGARPFGCVLMVASLNSKELYRLDPSGSIEILGLFGMIGSLNEIIRSKFEEFRERNDSAPDYTNELLHILKSSIETKSESTEDAFNSTNQKIITANFTRGALNVSVVS
jgi:20S proteasome subunit alpha 2